MKAAVVNVLGQPPVYGQFDDPVTEAGEVLVRVRAAGLHNLVKVIARGTHYSSDGRVPAVAGVDGVGVTPDGRRVYFVFVRKPWGTMAEFAAAQLKDCIEVPEGLDDLQAAAIVNPGMPAWFSLNEKGALKKGETVLILGATGVAGKLAIQLARRLGAKRIVGAGRKVGALAGTDVDRAISLSQPEEAIREAFRTEAAAGIDVVVDYLWGRPTELLLEALARQFSQAGSRPTRLVQVGDMAGKTITLAGATLRSIDLTIMGSGFGSVPMERVQTTVPHLFELAAVGGLKVDVEPVPIERVEETWNCLKEGQRIVFTMSRF
jgi:NADPH:quinone reductase-like Zn-dependent oxidoreductase